MSDARTTVPGVDALSLVGTTCTAVEVHGKHLMMRFTDDGSPTRVLHTHMRMTGSWHVYQRGVPWKRPERQARIVIECGERLAVCFNAPVIELTVDTQDGAGPHESIRHLGPDLLVDPFDAVAVVTAIARRPAEAGVGELLLDQRLVAGIGNIYRCEAMFLCGWNPWTPRTSIDAGHWEELLWCAARLMRANVPLSSGVGRELGGGTDRTWVYRRAGKPCRRCGATVRSRPQGTQARTAYWCPRCQPAPPAEGG